LEMLGKLYSRENIIGTRWREVLTKKEEKKTGLGEEDENIVERVKRLIWLRGLSTTCAYR